MRWALSRKPNRQVQRSIFFSRAVVGSGLVVWHCHTVAARLFLDVRSQRSSLVVTLKGRS